MMKSKPSKDSPGACLRFGPNLPKVLILNMVKFLDVKELMVITSLNNEWKSIGDSYESWKFAVAKYKLSHLIIDEPISSIKEDVTFTSLRERLSAYDAKELAVEKWIDKILSPFFCYLFQPSKISSLEKEAPLLSVTILLILGIFIVGSPIGIIQGPPELSLMICMVDSTIITVYYHLVSLVRAVCHLTEGTFCLRRDGLLLLWSSPTKKSSDRMRKRMGLKSEIRSKTELNLFEITRYTLLWLIFTMPTVFFYLLRYRQELGISYRLTFMPLILLSTALLLVFATLAECPNLAYCVERFYSPYNLINIILWLGSSSYSCMRLILLSYILVGLSFELDKVMSPIWIVGLITILLIMIRMISQRSSFSSVVKFSELICYLLLILKIFRLSEISSWVILISYYFFLSTVWINSFG